VENNKKEGGSCKQVYKLCITVYNTLENTCRREELYISKQGISSLEVINIFLASLLSLIQK